MVFRMLLWHLHLRKYILISVPSHTLTQTKQAFEVFSPTGAQQEAARPAEADGGRRHGIELEHTEHDGSHKRCCPIQTLTPVC